MAQNQSTSNLLKPSQKSAAKSIQFSRADQARLQKIAHGLELIKRRLAAGETDDVQLVSDLLNAQAWKFYEELDTRFDQVATEAKHFNP